MNYKTEFDKGYKAFKASVFDNPYAANTDKHREWARGWNKSYKDNLERVKQKEELKHNGFNAGG